MKFKIIKYMTGYAIKQKFCWWWVNVTYGHFGIDAIDKTEEDVMEFETFDDAVYFLAKTLVWTDYRIVEIPRGESLSIKMPKISDG